MFDQVALPRYWQLMPSVLIGTLPLVALLCALSTSLCVCRGPPELPLPLGHHCLQDLLRCHCLQGLPRFDRVGCLVCAWISLASVCLVPRFCCCDPPCLL